MTKPTPPESDPGGRPTKFTEEFVAAAMEVINDEQNALIFTDEELVFQINEKLPLEARISPATWKVWKAGDISDDIRAQKFFALCQKALFKQKRNLFAAIDDPKNQRWQKDAWKIERKFDDWNIKQKITLAKAPEDGAAALALALLGTDNPAVDGSPTDIGPKAGNAETDSPGV